MFSFQKIDSFLVKWLDSLQGDSFLLQEAADAVLNQFPEEKKDEGFDRKLRNSLDTMDGIVRTFKGERFYRLESFMHGLKFLCRPRPFEIQAGILVPGARFEPFHPDALFADDLEIVPKGQKSNLAFREFTCPYDKVSEIYFLLGPSGTMDIFNAESDENFDAIRAAGGLKTSIRLTQTVLDLTQFYQENDVRSGDLLEFTVQSYMNGTMTLRKLPAAEVPSDEEFVKRLEAFEENLAEVCRDYKDTFTIPFQLMYAFIYAKENGHDMRSIPWCSVDEYHKQMRRITFNRSGVEWTLADSESAELAEEEEENLKKYEFGQYKNDEEEHDHNHDGCDCGCGHDHDHNHEDHQHDREIPMGLNFGDFTISGGAMESLSAILLDTKAPFSEPEFHAVVYDMVASGIETFEEFLRINDFYMNLKFKDEAQKVAYQNFVEDIWEYIREIYSQDYDARRAPLRQRLLEIAERRRTAETICSAKHNTEAVRKLRNLHQDISDTFVVLDADTGLLEDDAFDDLELRIGDIEGDLEMLED